MRGSAYAYCQKCERTSFFYCVQCEAQDLQAEADANLPKYGTFGYVLPKEDECALSTGSWSGLR